MDNHQQDIKSIDEKDLPDDIEELKKMLIESKKNELYLQYSLDGLNKGKIHIIQ
jgi:hypothetical protein